MQFENLRLMKEKKKIKTMYMNCLLSFLRAWHLYLQSFLNAAKRFTLLFPFVTLFFFFFYNTLTCKVVILLST